MKLKYQKMTSQSTPIRLLIVDQNLTGYAGHYYDYSRAIIKAARAMGWIPLLAAHQTFPFDTLDGAPVVGRFLRGSMAGRGSFLRRALRQTFAAMPSAVRRALAQLSSPLKLFPRQQVRSDNHLGKTLLPILSAQKLSSIDHVLIHSLSEEEFLGLIDCLLCVKHVLPHLHILLRYEGTDACRAAFKTITHHKWPMSLWTDTDELADHYRDLGCLQMGVLPIPHGIDAVPPRLEDPHRPITISYLGGARKDKGFDHLPDLIGQLLNDQSINRLLHFQIQTNYGISREEPLMQKTVLRLNQYASKDVRLISAPLNSEDSAKALFATDLLLLLYDRETYRWRSSGLLIQAMVAGVPTIIPNHTSLSASAPHGACIVFDDTESILAAVKTAIANLDSLRRHAQAYRATARAHHDPVRLLAMLAAAAAVRGPIDQSG